MQIQPKSPVGSGVSTAVQEAATVSSKEGAQGLGSSHVNSPAVGAAGTTAVPQQAQSMSEQLREALSKLNETVQKTQPQLEFSVDEETELRVVKLIDKDNGEIIRQFPSKEMIALARSIDQYTGMLIKAKS